MARKRKQNPDQIDLLDARVATAPCVPGIREKVKAWREGGCKGVSDTTHILLNYWFHTDHKLPDGRKFKYHHFQREAIETLIYLYEVAKVRRHKNLVETFATRSDLRLLWCENTTRLTGKPWAYLKVLQTAYKQLQPTRFEDLLVLEPKKLL